jgi:alkylated DNA repair protein alkB homolog 7
LADDTIDDTRIVEIFARTRQLLEKEHLEYTPVRWLPCHGIDLKKDGELNAHVDSVKFSGDLVAGISLLSPAIMRLAPHIDGGEGTMEGYVDLCLPPLSLYVLTGVARYRYSHELLKTASTARATDGSCFHQDRDHRLSVIFRDAKREE